MEIVGILYFDSGRLSAFEEMHQQPGVDGRDQGRGKSCCRDPLAGDFVGEVPGIDPSGSGAAGGGHEEVAQDKSKTDLDMYLSVMDSELKKVEDALKEYNAWSTDPAAIALRGKISNLRQARVSLVALRGD